jgi:prolactin regulatory element-binding protein
MFNFNTFQSKIRNIDGGAHGKVRKVGTVKPDEERVPEPTPAPASSPVEEPKVEELRVKVPTVVDEPVEEPKVEELRVKVPEVVEEPEEEPKVEEPVFIAEESLYR